ncbi:hypothetical protein ACEPAI_4919 [Sanghuangporus weigelae]
MPHPAPPAFICGACRKKFSRKADCLRHVQTHNADAKRYKCAWPGCKHSTLQKTNLKTHFLATHLRERPYQCNINGCKDTFGDQSSLIRHEKRTHGFYRRNHPYVRPTIRAVIDLDESDYIKGAVPGTPVVTPEPSTSGTNDTTSPGTSMSPAPSLTSGSSFPSSRGDEVKTGSRSPRESGHMGAQRNSPSRFTCDGGPRDPFANPDIFEEFMAQMPELEDLLRVDFAQTLAWPRNVTSVSYSA